MAGKTNAVRTAWECEKRVCEMMKIDHDDIQMYAHWCAREKVHVVGVLTASHEVAKSVRGSLPPRTAVKDGEAKSIEIGSMQMAALEQVPHLVTYRQSKEERENGRKVKIFDLPFEFDRKAAASMLVQGEMIVDDIYIGEQKNGKGKFCFITFCDDSEGMEERERCLHVGVRVGGMRYDVMATEVRGRGYNMGEWGGMDAKMHPPPYLKAVRE